MASFNKVILIGNMTADPELKQTAGGISVCSFSIAVNRRFAKADQNQQSVDFINIVAWRQSAEFVSRYFAKGSPILVCGQLQTRSYTDNQGQIRHVTEVVADEVSFVAPANQNSVQAPKTDDTRNGPAGATYMPAAYTSGPRLNDAPDYHDERLPF